MPVPFLSADEASSEPPDAAEVLHLTRAFVSATAPPGGATRLQTLVTKALVEALTDHTVDMATLEPITSDEHAQDRARRTKEFRLRTVQIMVLLELLLSRCRQRWPVRSRPSPTPSAWATTAAT